MSAAFCEAASTCVVRDPDRPAACDARDGDESEALAAFLEAAAALERDRRGDERGHGEDAEEDAGEAEMTERETRVVDMFGEAADRAGVRAQLLGFYEATRQLARPETDADADASRATVTEMTLRVDTELELLRRRCFAERNARWGFATPDMLALAPAVEPTWAPRPANHKLALQAADAAARGGKAALVLAPAALTPPSLDGFPVGEPAREPLWPPGEFSARPPPKPKARGGKRKATPAAVVAARAQASVSIYPRMCVDCHTQSTPLWRKRSAVKRSADKPTEQAAAVLVGVAAVNGGQTADGRLEAEEQEDVCLQCYLKTERRDLFERKKADKARKERERRDRAAALAAAEKKRVQHLKKQQKKQQQDQIKKERAASLAVANADPTEAPLSSTPSEPPMVLKFTKDELDAALERNAAKKEKKRSHHDKKKKKKKKRKLEHYDDSDTDGLTPMPSPPQMARYDYADLSHPEAVEDVRPAFDAPEQPVSEQLVEDSDTGRHASRSSRKRGGKSKSPGGSSSKKRRSVDVAAEPAPIVVSPPPPVSTPSSRPSRAKATAPVAVAPTPTAKRKRARSKKESNRERELRALGQYCPVCNEVYEEDDDSSFVCCDSCEMWVHAACDQSLTPEAVTALANPDEKYICPLCAGR